MWIETSACFFYEACGKGKQARLNHNVLVIMKKQVKKDLDKSFNKH
jgi:hypothetical protein